jgi:hypothetical protein
MMTIREIEAACDSAEPPNSLRHPLELPELTLAKTFYPYGFPVEVRTNAPEIIDFNEHLWSNFSKHHSTQPIASDIYVTEGNAPAIITTPTYRFASPLFTSILDGANYVVSDLERRHSYTVMTYGMLEHPLQVEYFFLSIPLCTLPVTAVHAGCVAWNGRGVMLCGDSGAGKSTLSYACARAGWEYVSDDATYLLDCERHIVSGNSHQVRLRPAGADLFGELRGLELTPRAAGKPSIEFSTIPMQHVKRRPEVEVDSIVFLNRTHGLEPGLFPYRKDVARLYMNQSIFGTEEARRNHERCIDRLLTRDVYELRYTDLDFAIDQLRALLQERP